MTLPNGPAWTFVHLGLKFPGAAAVLVASSVYLTGLTDDPTPMVALTFDDGYASVYDVALPALRQRDMVATAYLNTVTFGDSRYIEASTLPEFVEAEWEIGSHGTSHVSPVTLDPINLQSHLMGPITALAEMSGQEIFSYASPMGEYNDTVMAGVQRSYYNHVGAWTLGSIDYGVNTVETFNPWHVNRIDSKHLTAEEICDRVNTLEDNTLYSVIFHDITDVPGEYNTTPEKFEAILDCVEASGVNVVRMTDAVQVMENRKNQ